MAKRGTLVRKAAEQKITIKELLIQAGKETNWIQEKMAELLTITPGTLSYWMKKTGLNEQVRIERRFEDKTE